MQRTASKQWVWKVSSNSSQSFWAAGGAPPALARVLENRGIFDEQQLRFFLQPPHRLPYCPLRLSGMEPALRRLLQAVEMPQSVNGPTRVGIVGDFDVDGITGAAILVEGLSNLNVATVPYIPHRVAEGHGLSEESVRYLSAHQADLIITVDCGVSSHREVDLAQSLGMRVIVTDHHAPPAVLPNALALIDPCLPGNEYPFPKLCGAGLALKLMQGLYEWLGQPMPRSLLELAALGTIADMVPLVDENRFLVQEGLAELSLTRRPGLKAIYRYAGLEGSPITAETVAFQLAPRLNAAGRMGHAGDSLRLLTTSDEAEAEELAARLEEQNLRRRELTGSAIAGVESRMQEMDGPPSFILAEDASVTPGIAGLVAARLSRTFHRPAVALASIDDNTLMGSGRSIPEFNLVESLGNCADLLVRFGGHSQAAGFTIRPDNVAELRSRLVTLAEGKLMGAEAEPTVEIDAEVQPEELSREFQARLEELEPFGVGNPRPTFLARQLPVVESHHLGESGQHLKLLVGNEGCRMPAMLFNRADEWDCNAEAVDLVYTVRSDSWRGRRQLSLVVEDFRPAGATGP